MRSYIYVAIAIL